MISVIVPVYNVELYLRKCIDSILAQTYRDLEILVVDDGSTDGSGAICDEYAGKEDRIKVFHTKNRGLSAARNLGLDEAKGEWIGFVDSDDWIEPDMYEVLIKRAEKTGADVVECGLFRDFPTHRKEIERTDALIESSEACKALLEHRLLDSVWNKLWNRDCFSTIRFPEGRINEDVATTYRLLQEVNRLICTVNDCKYHYVQRQDSLSKQHTMRYLVDYWTAHYERYNSLVNNADESSKTELLRCCTSAVARTWAYCCDSPKADREQYREATKKMNAFTRKHIPLFGFKSWNAHYRIGVFFPHFYNSLSFRAAWLSNRFHRMIANWRTI